MRRHLERAAVVLAMVAIASAVAAAPHASTTHAASSVFPAEAATVESLVPAGWTIEQRHTVDLNGDGDTDVLLLLRQAAAGGTTPPRALLVALASAMGPRYTRLAVNERLVPRDPSGKLEDPMADSEITVRPGGFDLKLGMAPGVGSYLAATMRYRFRLEGRCVRLIGYDRAETHRGTLDTRDLSVNFLTGAVTRTTGNAQSAAARTQHARLTSNPRRCLPDLPSAWTFDPVSSTRSSVP